MSILTIMPQAVYGQGSPREDMKRTPEEFGFAGSFAYDYGCGV